MPLSSIQNPCRIFKIASLVLATSVLAGCPGEAPSNEALVGLDPAATACTAGLAQIQVGDGFLEILCGCTSSATGAGVVVSAPIAGPTAFVCHVPTGTVVMWQVLGTQLWHQIEPLQVSGGSSFPSGQLIKPEDPDRASVAQFTTPGTYGFQDAMNSGLQGEIVVP